MSLEFILSYCQGKYGFDFSRDEVLNTKYLAHCRLIAHQVPTYWLEPDLAKPLLATNLPDDFLLDDVHWRFPAMRIYLPRNLLTIRREERDCSLMYMDIVRADSDFIATLPTLMGVEMMDKGTCVWIPKLKTDPGKTAMAVTGVLELDCTDPAVGYATTCPISDWSIKQVYDPKNFHHIASPTASDELDSVLTTSMLRLAFNILMLMGSYPEEYNPKEVIRKAKQEGKRILPALHHAKFVGASLLRPKHKPHGAPTGTGHEVAPHWVKGHWRRVAYGPKHSQRRLQWIGMYAQGDISKL
jgi:hypothetical protein